MPLARLLSRLALALALASSLLLGACTHALPATDTAADPYAELNDGTQSYDILKHDPIANHVKVKHILIAWKDLERPDRPLDPLAEGRSYADAQALARELLAKLRAGAPIEPLMAQYSADPGSASTGRSYDVSPDATLVSEFKSLSMRLQVNEAGIVKSAFGLHVIQRVE